MGHDDGKKYEMGILTNVLGFQVLRANAKFFFLFVFFRETQNIIQRMQIQICFLSLLPLHNIQKALTEYYLEEPCPKM